MKRFLVLILLSVSIFLASCVSVGPAFHTFASRRLGQPANDFFMRYGPPIRAFDMKEQGILYVWQSDVQQLTMPETVTPSGTDAATTVVVSGPTTVTLYCQLQFHVATNGRIVDIKLLKDTWGVWTTSRFYDLFHE